jgi:type I restriction enzyme, S subunit
MSDVVTKELPEGWERVPLKDAVHIILGQSPSSSTYNQEGEGLPFFQGKTEFGEIYPTVRKWCTEPKKIAEQEDVLVSVRAPVGPTNLAPYECAIGRGLAALRPLGGSDSKYFLYLIRRYQNNLAALGTGTTFEAISGDTLKNFLVPIAPPEQQKRIVAKIEELFSHIDAGIEALKKAKQLLKLYRQSVLKAAVTGELTKEWRGENKAKLEPASKLLERILKKRREKWEAQQLEQFKTKGKMPKNDKWKEKYKEPELPNAKNSEVIPGSWAYCGIEMLLPPDKAAMKTGPFGSLLKKHEHKTEGVPVLGIENIASMQFVPGSKIHIAEEKSKELDGYRVIEGDILISRSGTVGEVCVVPDMGEARISTNLMKLSLMKDGLNPIFFTYLFNGSPFILGQVAELCKGSTRDFLNQEILKKLLLVLPPYEEQLEIVSQVEDRFYKLERLDNEIDLQLLKSEKNKQSVLASVFSGKLVGASAEAALVSVA